MEKEQAPCSSCVRQTAHDVLFRTGREVGRNVYDYELLSCCGCGTVSMRHSHNLADWTKDGKIFLSPAYVRYFPSPVSRKEPEWLVLLDRSYSGLLKEIYSAVHGGQYRLAAMGIRALLEQVMIAEVGDIGGFDRKLDEFQKAGFISEIQREAMRATLDVGDAAIHRAFEPNAGELKTSLDIVEGVMSAIYSHQRAVEKLGDRVPPRGDNRGRK